MTDLINFLNWRLQKELPHADIHKEDLHPRLKKMLIAEQKKINSQFAKKAPRICAVLMAFYPDQTHSYLPFIRRPDKSRVHPGQIAFPGGKQEEQDVDLIDTALRETREEIGVSVSREQVIGSLTPVYIPPSNALVTPVISFLPEKPSYLPDPDEVDKVLDISVHKLIHPASRTSKKIILSDGSYIHMPAFQVDDTFIWGGTARMVAELAKILTEAASPVRKMQKNKADFF